MVAMSRSSDTDQQKTNSAMTVAASSCSENQTSLLTVVVSKKAAASIPERSPSPPPPLLPVMSASSILPSTSSSPPPTPTTLMPVEDDDVFHDMKSETRKLLPGLESLDESEEDKRSQECVSSSCVDEQQTLIHNEFRDNLNSVGESEDELGGASCSVEVTPCEEVSEERQSPPAVENWPLDSLPLPPDKMSGPACVINFRDSCDRISIASSPTFSKPRFYISEGELSSSDDESVTLTGSRPRANTVPVSVLLAEDISTSATGAAASGLNGQHVNKTGTSLATPGSEAGSLLLPICRICHMSAADDKSASDMLIAPCRCAGTMQFIHHACLMKWLEICTKRSKKAPTCELCQYQYQWHKKFKVSHWKVPRCSLQDKILHSVFLISVVIMIGCATSFIMCFKEDQGTRSSRSLELTQEEIITLACGVLFFVAFFVAMYVEIKAKTTIYKLLLRFFMLNQQWYVDEYDRQRDACFTKPNTINV